MAQFEFPKNFLWGTSSSAYQFEGNNKNTDWWVWENRDRSKDFFWLNKKFKSSKPLEPSGKACDFYNKYKEDFNLCVQCRNNAIRLGIEWARIQPTENQFDQAEIEHYKNMLSEAKKLGLTTFVTLHHFTNPLWFTKKGGWCNLQAPCYFGKYAQKCAKEFGNLIDFYLTINEPQVYSMLAYLQGRWPPQKTNPFAVLLVQINFMRAHNKAYSAIKREGDFPVGFAHNLIYWEVDPKNNNVIDKLIKEFLSYLNNDFFIRPILKKLDFIGLNYYFTNRISGLKIKNLNDRVSDIGWWLNPKGLENVLLNLKKYNLPIYITEHGLSDKNDHDRSWYLTESIRYMAKAIEAGVDLRGYFHWALTDNFEWAEGYTPKFGLVYIDRDNDHKRIPRDSFYEYSKICKNNTIMK